MKVKCPFCIYEAHVAHITKTSPDPLRDLKRHLTNAAKNEALDYCIAPTPPLTPHLDYFRLHTSDKKVIRTLAKRVYDSDLEIETL